MSENYLRAIALSEDDDKVDIRKEYVGVLLRNERYATAEEQLLLLETEDEENSYEYVLMRVEGLLDRELYDDAGELLEDVEETELSDILRAEYYWAKSAVLFGLADRDGAEGWIDKALVLADGEAKYHLLLGQISFEVGNESESKTELERAVDLDLEGDVSAEAAKILDRL